MRNIFLLIIFIFLSKSYSQSNFSYSNRSKKTHTVNGFVEDARTNEKLIGCFVFDSISNRGIVTNSFGYFNLTLNEGSCNIIGHNFGYVNSSIICNLQKDTTIIIKLNTANPTNIAEVTVSNSTYEAKLSRPQMGLLNITNKDVKQLPSLLGEADVMRAIQIMPGIQAANERSTGI